MQTIPDSKKLIDGHAMIARAVIVACSKHRTQVRKGTTIPYISHLFAVAGLVLEHGGSLAQATAGVLHDVVEDTTATNDDVRTEFGDEIADIVEACTDTSGDATGAAKAPWRERKQKHLATLAHVSREAALVIACDKLHNLRTQISDLLATGHTVEFNASRDDREWLHLETLCILRELIPMRLANELTQATSVWHDLS